MFLEKLYSVITLRGEKDESKTWLCSSFYEARKEDY
ncbi:hypothetical protein CLCHR_21350 [Clostridium chromiireducens]|uniref:Uncharacterized protein n=1 Tax=Clostridium chromiireducens TaxID=225345 RepID=A0A1V4IQA5_9CLOT|nr:hypothetical protein CLCHR_21350 [Clostridium chromiireducens]